VILDFPYFKGEWSSLLSWTDKTSQADRGGLRRDKVENVKLRMLSICHLNWLKRCLGLVWF